MRKVRLLCLGISLLPSLLLAADGQQAPEAASALQSRSLWQGRQMAVATANPYATAAGVQMLEAGGNALDAAIAAQMVLALVEPQSSGLGGGGFLLYWDGRQLSGWDGRERAPAAADGQLLLDEQGQPLPFMSAVASGRSVGVPGLLPMLHAAQQKHGRLRWSRLLQPAIELAEQGFAVSARLEHLLRIDPLLRSNPPAAAFYYQADGTPWPVGHRLRNPALAQILRQLARQPDALRRAPAASAIVRSVQQPPLAGRLSQQDLQDYQPVQRQPLCGQWQQYRICGLPPPSSGWLTQMQILGLLDQLPPLPASNPARSIELLHRYSEASKLAWADRARYIADPAFTPAPADDWRSLLAPGYLRQRASLIGSSAMPPPAAGEPGPLPLALASQPEQPEYGTTQISVIDRAGRAVSMTSSIEQAFGSRRLCDGGTGLPGGFLLNNQLTDFAFAPTDAQGVPVANRVQPGKRPRSSMNPLLVFDAASGELLASLGSPGGSAIIHYTARSLLALQGTLNGQPLDAQAAINQGNFASNGSRLQLERGQFAPEILQALRERGQQVEEVELTSGLQILLRTAAGLQGGSDPRREGTVGGR